MVERSDPYAELGVAPEATQPEIREAFRRLLRQHHPDTRRPIEDDRESDEALQRTLAAYAALRRRQQQNQRRRTVAPPPGSVVRSTSPRPSSRGPALEASPVQWEAADDDLSDDRDLLTSRISLSDSLLPALLLRRWLLRDWGRR